MMDILYVVSDCSSPIFRTILTITKSILNIIQIAGPILLIIGLTINLTKLVGNPENKKLLKNIRNGAISAVILFFIPVLMDVVMNMVSPNFSVAACWQSVSVETAEYKTHDIYESKRKKVYSDPSDYEPVKNNNTSSSATIGQSIEGNARQVGDVVWDSNDVTKISNLTSSQLVAVLNAEGGNAKNFIPYATALITAEHKYSVNVFFLIGVEALESGWITSPISRNCNNLGGVCGSSAHPSNGCGSNSNCSFAYFDSVNSFVDYHASMLHNNYLTPGGSYYHGTSPSAVVTNYCPGCSSWPGLVITIANSLFDNVSSVM